MSGGCRSFSCGAAGGPGVVFPDGSDGRDFKSRDSRSAVVAGGVPSWSSLSATDSAALLENTVAASLSIRSVVPVGAGERAGASATWMLAGWESVCLPTWATSFRPEVLRSGVLALAVVPLGTGPVSPVDLSCTPSAEAASSFSWAIVSNTLPPVATSGLVSGATSDTTPSTSALSSSRSPPSRAALSSGSPLLVTPSPPSFSPASFLAPTSDVNTTASPNTSTSCPFTSSSFSADPRSLLPSSPACAPNKFNPTAEILGDKTCPFSALTTSSSPTGATETFGDRGTTGPLCLGDASLGDGELSSIARSARVNFGTGFRVDMRFSKAGRFASADGERGLGRLEVRFGDGTGTGGEGEGVGFGERVGGVDVL